jgi:hypothetical protein
MAANRIVLVNRSGDELFWGTSVLSGVATTASNEDDDRDSDSDSDGDCDVEPCPPTLRSSVFVRTTDPAEPIAELEVTTA